jgi:hypothetical protein
MGDSITDLSVDKKLEISENDMTHIYKFFNVDLSQEEMQKEDGGNKSLTEIFKFVALFSIVFCICIHPLSIGRFITNPNYRLIGQTLLFAGILFLYLYFNK